MREIKIASLFAGIGGFDLGISRAIDKTTNYTARTIWQCEINTFCQSILKRHWPHATLYPDITTINPETIEQPDIILSSFPCQDVSCAGKGEGINGKNTGLFWHAHRLIKHIRPAIVVMENVPAITWKGRGGIDVIESLAQIGYDAEWTIISARGQGANHIRKRWFLVAYATNTNSESESRRSEYEKTLERTRDVTNTDSTPTTDTVQTGGQVSTVQGTGDSTHTDSKRVKKQPDNTITMEETRLPKHRGCTVPGIHTKNHWENGTIESPLCRVDDGIPRGMDRLANRHRIKALRALGNAIVPQCAEYIGDCIVRSGLLEKITTKK